MDMPKPSEAHRKLEQLVGSWSGEEKIYPSPWDPEGGTAVGRVENRLALDGFVVVQEYKQERDGQISFRGHGVFGYDSNQDEYVLHWWDTTGMAPNVFRGTFEGNVLSLTDRQSQMKSRVTFTFEANSYRFLMEASQDGEQWQKFMGGDYSR